MTSMIERVARTIAENGWGARDWDQWPKERQKVFMEQARTVIETMRSPTDAMRNAGADSLPEFDDIYGTTAKPDFVDAGVAWDMMLNAALEEG